MSSFKKNVILAALFALMAFSFNVRLIFPASTIVNFEMQTCPFCYNQSFCDFVDDVQIETTFLEYILSWINRKYVFFGIFQNKSVALKRLAYKQEYLYLDTQVNNNYFKQDSKLTVSPNYFYWKSLALLNQSFTNSKYKMRLCPTLENVDLLFEPLIRRNRFNNFLFINIWTSLQLNPEPLFLQIFRSEDNWPVPEYIGGCGRITLVENCGKTIQSYLSHPWLFRIHIVDQLLWMAQNLTFNSLNFGVYLRDFSPDNIVIDSSMRIRIIDLEHVIVVDKNTPKKDQPSSWFMEHKSEHFFCENCLLYSPLKICEHHISDHNIYAVCKEFLNSIYPKDLGLLHSAPNVDYLNSKVGTLKYYVEECIQPSTNQSRFEIAYEFRKFLHELKKLGNFTIDEYKELI